jgi:hypothetical protein
VSEIPRDLSTGFELNPVVAPAPTAPAAPLLVTDAAGTADTGTGISADDDVEVEV